MTKLATVNLKGVEILEADVPIHGIGSPPEGDIYTVADLEKMASAHRELADAGEWQPPATLGHFPASGDPAVGWLDNLRVEGTKLVSDVNDVPRKFSELVKAKAYRTRSVTLKRVKSQKLTDGDKPKVYENVVSSLAWLGARTPAVRTLGDVAALYEAEGMTAPSEDDDFERVLLYAEGDLVWSPDEGNRSLEDAIRQALNPGAPPWRLWVRDVSRFRDVALVTDDAGESEAWVVPFTRNADGAVTLAATAEWKRAEQAWVEAAKAYEDAAKGEIVKPADTRTEMAETTYTDDQRRAFSEATSIELDKVTDEVMAAAGVAVAEPVKEEPVVETADTKAFEDRVAALEKRTEDAEKRAFEAERNSLIESALHAGQFEPGERESWEKAYETNPEGTKAAISRLPKNDDLAREYGSSEEAEPVNDEAALDKAYEAEYGGTTQEATA